MSDPIHLVAIDLGSNSFRMLVATKDLARAEPVAQTVEVVKRTVRLAAGLRTDGSLDEASIDRACIVLKEFGQRLRVLQPAQVRAVATNTWRVARNAAQALARAEAALGMRIEVIGGDEEARLVYQGAAAELPVDGLNRLVVDIGGGSTELIIGNNAQVRLLESTALGSVVLSGRYFSDGAVSPERFALAIADARARLSALAPQYREHGWRYAVGTSGTAKAITRAAFEGFGEHQVTRSRLAFFADTLIASGHVDAAPMPGLSPERRPALAGGLAALCAVFDELSLDSMRYCDSALGQGVLHDLANRVTHEHRPD